MVRDSQERAMDLHLLQPFAPLITNLSPMEITPLDAERTELQKWLIVGGVINCA